MYLSAMANIQLKDKSLLSFLRANPQLNSLHVTICNIKNIASYLNEMSFVAYITDDYEVYQDRVALSRGKLHMNFYIDRWSI